MPPFRPLKPAVAILLRYRRRPGNAGGGDDVPGTLQPCIYGLGHQQGPFAVGCDQGRPLLPPVL